jgi:hypothetical protein
MPNMLYERDGHGATVLGNKIYVAGGSEVKKYERFDIKKKTWAKLCNADFEFIGVTLMSVKSRYVMAVGGRREGFNNSDTALFARLDSQKLKRGWKILHLAN